MNPRSARLKLRSNSAPLSSEHMRIRRCDFDQLVDRAVELRMKAKIAVRKRQKSPQDRPPPTPFLLMPRLGIIDDKSQDIIIAQLEVPDVSPESVKLELHGDKLTVSGERRPRLVTVPTEYEASFLHQSQTVVGGDQRPRLIMLGGGRVASFAVPLIQPQSRQSQPVQSGAPQPHGTSPASMVFYNEMRYGPFRRDLRVPLGTQASSYQALSISIHD
ncbi:hypothetical protein D9615_003305 [Tricholomella constricta]|uniref:SHSP domain-containing protein n=1 Tax=Tricholomella constricta TaxID=117010 RepID=A0A8H5M893_9AGAR|nr:hypothetical protein D9615_003305 [Tricholomella constricta]